MAQSMTRNVIDNFENIVQQLMQEAGAYVASGEPDDETEGNIRRLRLFSNALNAALNSVQFMPRPPVMPPPMMPPEPQSTAQPPQAPPSPQPPQQPPRPAQSTTPPRR